MAAAFFPDYPPYTGDEPYLYLCFHEKDAQRVKPFLDQLYRRHCRVWYSLQEATDSKRGEYCAKRVKKAALLVLWASWDASNSESTKSKLGYYQESGNPAIVIEFKAASSESGLSMLFTNQVKYLQAEYDPAIEDLASALMRTEGFTQQIIGVNDEELRILLHRKKERRIALMILAIALFVLLSGFLYARSNNLFKPETVIVESVTLSDAEIARAARDALSLGDNASLTQENIASIPMLRLESVPDTFDDLLYFSALTRLEIPQCCVEKAASLLDDATYTIVVYGEGENE